MNELHHERSKVKVIQGHTRSRLLKVAQGQGTIDPGHISMNLNRIDSKQMSLGLYQRTAPSKVKVKVAQGH